MKYRKIYIIITCVILFAMVGIGGYYVLRNVMRPQISINKITYPVNGIDVSAHNGNIDFARVAQDSISFVFIKATEGASFKDGKFEKNYIAARDAGLKVGAYHFFRFDINGTLQGMNFVSSIGDKILELPLAIDLEEHGNPETPTLSVIKRLQEMIDYLAGHGYDIIIYTNNNGYRRFVQSSFADYPLWLCRFTTPQEDVEWQFWQYSHWGEVDGIKGDVDLNIFNGSSYDFAQWLK
ncbi:MAG: GH25 family lysozyme [Muribaculaceae bacterium]